MKFFADTAEIAEIRELAETGLLDGVTTNPSLIHKSGRDFLEVVREIAGLVKGPVSAEVVALDFEGMMREAEVLRKIADNIAVKVPLTFPLESAVRVLIFPRSQSPAPVDAPWSLHSVMPSVLPAVKPVPVMVTTVPFVSPSCGEMVPAGAAWATPASTNRNAPASVISAKVRFLAFSNTNSSPGCVVFEASVILV